MFSNLGNLFGGRSRSKSPVGGSGVPADGDRQRLLASPETRGTPSRPGAAQHGSSPPNPAALTLGNYTPKSSALQRGSPMDYNHSLPSMDYKKFSEMRGQARQAFDAIEDWMADVFGGGRDQIKAMLDNEDLDTAVAQRRRGM